MLKGPAGLLMFGTRVSIAFALALMLVVHPAAADLLEVTFKSEFDGRPGGGSFLLDTSVQAQPGGPGPSPTYPTLYPNAIKNYQYADLFQSNSLLEATLSVWPEQTPVQGLPSLTEFNFGNGLVAGLALKLADQPSLGFQLSADPASYQLNSHWASFVNNSPFLVTSLEVRPIPEPPSFVALLILLAGFILLRDRRNPAMGARRLA